MRELTALSHFLNKENKNVSEQTAINTLLNMHKRGQFEEIIEFSHELLNKFPEAYLIWNIRGAALISLGLYNEALIAFKTVTDLNPDYAHGYNNLGLIFAHKEDNHKAEGAYRKALELEPNYGDAHYNLGNLLKNQNRIEDARQSYQSAIKANPKNAQAYLNMGVILKIQQDFDGAMAAYQAAIANKDDFAEAHNNIGNLLKDQGNWNEAIVSYQKAISAKPDYAIAYSNMGNAFAAKNQWDNATALYQKAIKINRNEAEPYFNNGTASLNLGDWAEASKYYEEALRLKPDFDKARAQRLHCLSHMCQWEQIFDERDHIPRLGTEQKAASPFVMLPLEDVPSNHKLRSETYAKENFPKCPEAKWEKSAQRPRKLRIGYFSADFFNHATMILMAQVFEKHDKERFEIFAYAYGPPKKDEMRSKLLTWVDEFHDINELSDTQVAALAKSNQLDIAVDLKGYTQDTRLGIFAHGLAPVQISYLGYPGTLGTDFIHYIVADQVVIPTDKQQYYSEKIIYLPDSYQPTDNTRKISTKKLSRSDVNLPENGFVFCCFNNNYKITHREFDIWMRLLQAAENSVLWLLKSNRWAEQNLKNEAKLRGIDPERLIFADKISQEDHLARHRLADLFLDTFNVNAHTTASDALWAELPVLTKLGESFAARVAGSLLSAIGLPELITKTEKEYELLALRLATEPEYLKYIKNKLSQNRLEQPLFNSEQYTRHLEMGYEMALEQHLRSDHPKMIFV